jgi:integrase
MAHIEKVTRVRWIITGAKGKKQYVAANTPGARKVIEKSKVWSAVIHQDGRPRRICLHVRDKSAAQTLLGELIKTGEHALAGIRKRGTDAGDPLAKPLAPLIDEYLAVKAQERHSTEHVNDMDCGLKAGVRHANLTVLRDITPEAIWTCLQAAGEAARTKNKLLGYWKNLCEWLVSKKLLATNPIAAMKRIKGRLTHERRAIGAKELTSLLEAARARPIAEMRVSKGPRKGQPVSNIKESYLKRLRHLGESRALLYEFAALTGLRRKEIHNIRVKHFHPEGDLPFVLVLGGANQKQSKPINQYIPAALAEKLVAYIRERNKQPEDRLVDFQFHKTAEILRADLAFAGIPYRDDRDRCFDFHALRHCTATYLVLAGVPVNEAQKYMRHADIRMTMQIYNDLELTAAANAVAKLPQF